MSIHHTVLAFFALAVGISAYSQEAAKRQMAPGGASMPSGVAGARMSPGTDITGMDLENAMIARQKSRADALERQLKANMDAVSKRNKDIGILDNVLRAALQLRSEFPNVAGPNAAGPNAATPNGANKTMLANAFNEVGKTDGLQQMGALTYGTKAELDNSIAKVKFKLDELGNSQQTDINNLFNIEAQNMRDEARLQRNEMSGSQRTDMWREFEIMKNLSKKTEENRGTVIRNMQRN